MADPNDTSPRRSARNKKEQTSTSAVDSTSVADVSSSTSDPDAYSTSLGSLKERIEVERAQLMRAHSLIRTLSSALLYLDDDQATSFVDTANVVADLINESVTRLEGIGSRAYERVEPQQFSVKEPRPAYLC